MGWRCRATMAGLVLLCWLRLGAQGMGGLPASTAGGANAPDAAVAGAGVTTLHATARLVVLDVVVSDGHGKPVKGLTAADFTLREDGVTQTLASLEEHDGTMPIVEPAPELPPNTFAVHAPETGNGAMTAIVLGHILWQDAPYVRDQLKAYLKATAPSTPVAIFAVDYLGMRLVQGFTSDQKVLQEAAASKRILPPLGLPPPGRVRPSSTVDLAEYLNAVPGRINVIWFSSGGGGTPAIGQGATGSAFADVERFVRDLNGTTSVLRLSRVAVYSVDASGLTCANSADEKTPCLADIEMPEMESPLFYVPVSGPQIASELAERTGGKAIFHTNGFKQAIADIVTTGAHYYTVSYTPTNADWNGRFRRISLQMARDSTAGSRLADWVTNTVKVEYRRGYYARDGARLNAGAMAVLGAAPKDAGTAPQRRLISSSPRGDSGPNRGGQGDPLRRAMAFGSVTPVAVNFRITVTPEPEMERVKGETPLPKDNFLTPAWKTTPFRNYRVRYSLPPGTVEFTASDGGYHATLRCVLVVYRDNGEAVNSIATTVPLEVTPEEYTRIVRVGLSYEQTVAIPQKINTTAIPVTANFFLRAGVEEVSSGKIGAVEVPVEWVKALVEADTAGSARAAR